MAQQILLKRLKGKLRIAHLFEKGKVYHSQNILLKILENNPDDALYAAVSVSKRNFVRAVDRNRIKRLMREAWRLEKPALENRLIADEKQRAIVFIFTGKEMPTYEAILLCVQTVLKKMPLPSDAPENEEVLS